MTPKVFYFSTWQNKKAIQGYQKAYFLLHAVLVLGAGYTFSMVWIYVN